MKEYIVVNKNTQEVDFIKGVDFHDAMTYAGYSPLTWHFAAEVNGYVG